MGVGGRIAPGQGVDRQGHEENDGQQPDPVETGAGVAAPLLLDEKRERDGQQSHRHIDVEDQVPREIVHQEAADQRPERDGSGGGHGPQSEGEAPLLRGELARHDGQAERLDHTAAHPLKGPRADQEGVALGAAAEPRSECEEDQPEDVDALVTEAVGDPARRGEHDGHGNHVGRHDPFGRGDSDAEGGHDGRDADVDHRYVEHGHERADHNQAQHPPFVSAAAAYAFPQSVHPSGRDKKSAILSPLRRAAARARRPR